MKSSALQKAKIFKLGQCQAAGQRVGLCYKKGIPLCRDALAMPVEGPSNWQG